MNVHYFAKTHIPSSSANSIQIVNMARAFCNYVDHVFLYVPFQFKRYLSNLLRLNLRKYGLDYPPNLVIKFLAKDKKNYFEQSCKMLIEQKRSQLKADLIYTRNLELAYYLAKNDFTFIYESHVFERDQTSSFFPEFVKEMNVTKGKIAAISTYIAQSYLQCGLKKEKIGIFFDGISKRFLTAVQVSKSKPKIKLAKLLRTDAIYKQKIILYAGSLREEKGIGFLLQASAKLPQYNFVIIGGRKKELARWQTKAVCLKNVFFHPYLPPKDVAEILVEADVLVMPYLKQGELIRSMSPLKLFEYLAAGKPVLAANLPAFQGILIHGQNGFLFEPEDLNSFKQILAQIEQIDLEEYAKQSLQSVQDFTWEKRAKKILDWFWESEKKYV